MSKLKAISTRQLKSPTDKIFTKRLLYLFLVCVVASITGCFIFDECSPFSTDCCECCNDRCNYYVDEPHYINKSGIPIKIYVRWISSNVFRYSYGYAQNEDTLHRTTTFSFPSVEFFNLIEIQFLENSTNCLVYSGPVQDSLADMHSWKAYEKGDTIPGVYSHEYFVRYFYTIAPEHRAIAKEEYCQAPYWGD